MSTKDHLIIFDTTLRDGEQSPGASMTREEKVRIAKALEKLKVDVIEAGFPAASPGDFEAVKAVAAAIRDSRVCGLARALDNDIDRVGEALAGAAAGRVHTFIATSPIHMEKKLGMTPEQVLDQAVHAVKRALRYTDDVEFSPEDAGRSELDFLCRVLEAVIERHLQQTNPGADPGRAVRGGELRTPVRRLTEPPRPFPLLRARRGVRGRPRRSGAVPTRPSPDPRGARGHCRAGAPAGAALVRPQGRLEAADAQDMLTWEHRGFSLHAAVRMAGDDRAGLERLLRDGARPAFALERLTQVTPERVVYRLPKLQPDGRAALSLTPLELLDRLAALIPPPRRHRHRYHGVLPPHAPLRAAVTAYGRDATATDAPAQVTTPAASAPGARTTRYHWAVLLARLFAIFPLLCLQCGAELRLIAFVTAAEPVARILTHMGEPAKSPRIAPARGPPAWDDLLEPLPDRDAMGQPAPEFQFDQRISW